MQKRLTVPILREAEFREAARTEGATIEIECLTAPDPSKRHRGEWLFFVLVPEEGRFLLVTSQAQERVVNTTEGVISFAMTALDLETVSVPLLAGKVATGMRRTG